MTAQGEDILAYLERAITATEEAARAAAATDPAPWTAATSTRTTIDHDPNAGSGLLLNAADEPLWDCEESNMLCMTAAASIHAALHDPASVLRRCAADRKLLELHGGRGHACPSYDYDGDLDEFARFYNHETCPVVQHLAEGYGWTEGER